MERLQRLLGSGMGGAGGPAGDSPQQVRLGGMFR